MFLESCSFDHAPAIMLLQSCSFNHAPSIMLLQSFLLPELSPNLVSTSLESSNFDTALSLSFNHAPSIVSRNPSEKFPILFPRTSSAPLSRKKIRPFQDPLPLHRPFVPASFPKPSSKVPHTFSPNPVSTLSVPSQLALSPPSRPRPCIAPLTPGNPHFPRTPSAPCPFLAMSLPALRRAPAHASHPPPQETAIKTGDGQTDRHRPIRMGERKLTRGFYSTFSKLDRLT